MKTIPLGTKVTLLLLAMMTMMSNVAVVTILPRLSEIFAEVDHIAFLSRMMITLPSLAIALLAPFLGGFVYKYGKRKSAIVGLFFFSVTGTAGLYLDGIYAILFSRFLLGIAIAILMIVSTSLIGDYFKGEERHKFMGLQAAFVSIGGIIFIVGGGVLSDMNWRYPFAIYGIGFIILLFAMKYIIEYTYQSQVEDEEEVNHRLYPIYIMAFLLMAVFYILPTQFPYLMINIFHATGERTGLIIASAFVFNAIGALSFAPLKKYLDYPEMYMLGMGIIAIGFIGISQVTSLPWFFVTAPIIGLGGGILMTNITAWLLHYAHSKKRVKASAYLTSSLFLGQFFSPILTYPVVQYFGIVDFFKVMGIALIVILFLALVVKRIKREGRE
jgi:MFS family permease